MKSLPPGPIFLARSLPYLLAPASVTLGVLRVADTQLGLTVSPWTAALLALLARPVLFVFQRYYSRWADARAAARMGASILPHVEEKGLGFAGTTIIKRLLSDVAQGYPGDSFLEWSQRYGNTYQMRLLSDNRAFTTEPEHVKQILATQFNAFEKGPYLQKIFQPFLGTGVFNSDGEMWKFHRAMTRPFFTRERISHFEMFDSNSDRALKLGKARLREGYPIDIQDLAARFTLDSATQFLFGSNVDSLSAGLAYPESSGIPNSSEFTNHPSNLFVNAFMAGQLATGIRSRIGSIWPLMEFWKDNVTPLRKVIDEFTEPLLDEALAKKEKNQNAKEGEDHGDTLLSHLVQQTEDRTVLIDELLNLLVAGRDTTASTLTFSFYMLSENPKIADRLRQEIMEKVGPNNMPTYENIREMKFLRAFLNEVMRLYPPVPFDGRTTNKGVVLDSKVPGSKRWYIAPKTRFTYSIFHMQRRTDLWGPDAEVFDPDRFLDERVHKYLTPNPFIFTPFNAGPRICLGQQFAYQESSFFLVRLMQQFTNFRLAPDAQPADSKPPASWAECGGRKGSEKIMPALHLTMSVKGGLWGRMDEVKSDAT
jgi:cytochrome P450